MWQVEKLLPDMGGRPCWSLKQYDDFNAENAKNYYAWAASDPRVIGIVIWPWGGVTGNGYLPIAGGAYAGVDVMLSPKVQPNATATWAAIGEKIRKGQGQPKMAAVPPPPPPPPLPTVVMTLEEEQEEWPELPTDLEEAQREILRLRAALLLKN